jgi:hypothetical protein
VIARQRLDAQPTSSSGHERIATWIVILSSRRYSRHSRGHDAYAAIAEQQLTRTSIVAASPATRRRRGSA